MNKVLVTIGLLLITVLAVLFAAPALIDWSRYRSTFESEASQLLGRRVRVGDQVQLRLLPTPYISFDNVRVADASGRFDTPLLRMDSFRMQLSTSALLTGAMVAQDVELKSPTVRLAIGRDGKGNWEGLLPPLKTGNAPAAPGALQSLSISTIHITHGAVDLVGASDGQQWRFDDVTGDVDAGGPQGPFRFKGTYRQDGNPADLRLSVGRDDAAGKLRLKVSTHGADPAAASYTFDGAVASADGLTTLTGDLQAMASFPAAAGSNAKAAASGLDLKSKLTANSAQAKLDELEIVIDGAGRPQRLTGSATLGLNGKAASDVVLKSTWLDLDQIARATHFPSGTPDNGAADKPSAKDGLQGFLALANSLPGWLGKGHLRLAVEEARFGGSAITALQISAERTSNGLTIESLTAKLPGQSLISASGDINTLGASHFDGQVRLWGTNLASMANWAEPSLQLKESTGASPYLIDTEIAVDSARFTAEKLRAEIAGTTVTGGIRYVAAPQSLSITLDSNRLDLARDFDSPVNLLALAGLSTAVAAPDAAASTSGLDLKALLTGDTFLDLRIGHLLTAQGALHDVSAKLDRSNGRLNIPGIDLTTDGGFALHLEGALQVKDDQGQGQLRLLVAAPSPDAIVGALKIAGLASSAATAEKPLAALTPLTLAGTVELGGKSSTSESLALDGSAAGSRLRISLHRDSGETDWQSGQLDAAADLSNPDAERLLAQIALGLDKVLAPAKAGSASGTGIAAATPAAPGAVASPGRLSFRLSGIPEDGLTTRVGLTTGAIDATFDGKSTYGADAVVSADGTVAVAAKEANRLVRVVGLEAFVPEQPGELKLSAQLHRDATLLALSNVTAAVGGVQSVGEVTLTAGMPRPRLVVQVQSNTLRLDHWLSRLTSANAGAAARDLADGAPWSDQSFDFEPTQAVEAKITANAKQLVLANGYSLDDARLTADVVPGKIDLRLAAGRGLQGDWSGRLLLEKASAGATLYMDAVLDKARLDQLGGALGAIPRPEGELALKVELDGRGLSPRDVVGSANGKGTFSLSEGALTGFSANGIDAAARTSLADQAPVSAETLSRSLLEASKAGAFAFRGAKGNLTIADGAVRFDKMLVDSAQSQLEIANRIDLAKLQLASLWRLQPKPASSGKPPLPAVQFSYLGPLSDLAHVQPAIDFADLKQDLEARKLLGEPEQSLGIWPADSGAGQGPEADNTPAVPAPMPADTTAAAKPASLTNAAAAPASTAAVVGNASPASTGLVIGNPTATAAAAPADTAGAVNTAADNAPKRPIPRPRKKKTGWAASLLQGLFGN